MNFSCSNRWKWKTESLNRMDSTFSLKCFCPIYLIHNNRVYVPIGYEITGGFYRLLNDLSIGPEMVELHITILNFDFFIKWEK